LYVKLVVCLLLIAIVDWGLLSGVCALLHLGSGDVELSAANDGSLSLNACKGSDGKLCLICGIIH
jgi:hypothetical protein